MVPTTRSYTPKEVSWLWFNERLLSEAEDETVPLAERFRFLGIYSNNLDEYFRVRVATLKRLSTLGPKSVKVLGYDAASTLKEVQDIVLIQRKRFDRIFSQLVRELARHDIVFVNETQLNAEQARFVSDYFRREVRTHLMPFMIEEGSPIPDLKDDSIYFAICLARKKPGKRRYSLLEIPSSILPRIVALPPGKKRNCLMFIDDIIRFGLKELFFLFEFDEISAYTIKVTKDAELDIVDDISETYIENITRSLQLRKKGPPVRFIYDREIPADLLRTITRKLNIGKNDVVMDGTRYHNLKDLMKLQNLGNPEFYYETYDNIRHPELEPGKSILSAMWKKDILLFFPYHSFDYIIDLLREASIDPLVKSIEITLYRLARNSSVINALLNAVRNGKTVTTVLELQARFDEEANIYWGNRLLEEGVRVIYGVPGLKVHAKLCLITREKDGSTQRYACVGTGNFNEETARVYTDHILLTSDKKITNEVLKVFNFFNANYKKDNFYHLVLSPFYLRNKISLLIDNEIKNAKAGRKAFIYMKLNNITDNEIIEHLYEASGAGVDIRLMVRGMISVVPGLKGISENIRATGIVDRYLEHTRFMIFCNDGKEECFISSSDLMTRNIERRIEVTCPIWDPALRKELRDLFRIQWRDNVKARVISAKGVNKIVKNTHEYNRSQVTVREYLKNNKPGESSPGR
ncbi:MAG: polyphosphate kinase 1 [Bacteroidales bacterium]|jgi:polyphosphate kinase|nr:polyphosphate kinase 1 [Bacteroidales bacterium]